MRPADREVPLGVARVYCGYVARQERGSYWPWYVRWRRPQLSRNLAVTTVEARERLVRRFLAHSNEMPWRWDA